MSRHARPTLKFITAAKVLKREEADQVEHLRRAMGRIHELSTTLAGKLVAVAQEEERVWLDAVTETTVPLPGDLVEDIMEPKLRLMARRRLPACQ